jgi:hypothetical protein
MSFPTPELRSELKRRGLPHDGTRTELIKRIKYQNKLILSPAGQWDIFHKKLDLHHKQSLKKVVPFPRFPKLPPEIRLLIWEFSFLPRILTTTRQIGRSVKRLRFMQKENHFNPVTLSVCRESRAVTLKHYRLCFGTTNIYADLSRDVLYFDHSWWNQFLGLNSMWRRIGSVHNRYVDFELDDNVKADLQQINHIAFLSNSWIDADNPIAGESLRSDFKLFPGLKDLSIVTEQDYDYSGTPGYVEFTADVTQGWEAKLKTGFLTMNLNDAEKKNDLPDVHIVSAATITHIPGDDWDRDRGEPFVGIQNFS